MQNKREGVPKVGTPLKTLTSFKKLHTGQSPWAVKSLKSASKRQGFSFKRCF